MNRVTLRQGLVLTVAIVLPFAVNAPKAPTEGGVWAAGAASESAPLHRVRARWIRRYGTTPADAANDIALDNAGNVYLTGYLQGVVDPKSSTDFATFKYNKNGVRQWGRFYGSWQGTRHGGDQAHAIAVDGQANVYVTGESLGVGYSNFLTIKYDTDGNELWVRRYRRPGASYAARATDIAVDKAGNVYVTGYERLDRTADLNYLTIKYNKRGKRMWVRRLKGAAYRDNTANAIVVDGSGNVYVTGEAWKSNAHSDAVTVKYNTFGVRKWIKRYNGSANDRDYATGIALDSNGNILVTGYATVDHGTKGSDPDYFTIKYAPNGKSRWVRLYNGPAASTDFANAVAVDSNNNVLVTGQSSSSKGGDYLTVKYDSRGVSKWQRRYNGKGNVLDSAKAVGVDGLGNVYVTGESTGTGATGIDYATIKYKSNGKRQWVKRYNGPVSGIDRAKAIAVDAGGAAHVTGDSFGKANTFDMLTIKY